MASAGSTSEIALRPLHPRSRPVLVVGGVAVLIAIAFAIGPIARSMARSRASALGIDLAIGETRLGLGRVHFADVTLASREVPSVTVALANVDVTFTRRVEVHGGTVRVEGPLDDIERQLKAWRSSHVGKGSAAAEGGGSAHPISADGIDLRWTHGDERLGYAWGLRYERRSDGGETFGEDLARASLGGSAVTIKGARVRVERDGSRRVLDGISMGRLDAVLDLDESSAVGTPRAPALQAPVAGVPLPGPERDGRGQRLRAKLARAADTLASVLRPTAKLEFSGAHLEVRHAGQALNVGPASVIVERSDQTVTCSVTSGSTETSAPVRLAVSIPLHGAPVDVALSGGPVSLRSLGVVEHDMGLENVDRAEVEVNGHATLSADGRSLHVSGRSRLSDLSLDHPKLAREPVRGIRLGLSGDADVTLDGTLLRFDDLELTVGKVKALASGEIARDGQVGGDAKGKVHVSVPLAACADMFASIPSALVPLLSGLEVKGTFAFSGDLEFDTRRPGDTRIDWNAANECRIGAVPPSLSTARFARPWTRTVLGPGGVPAIVESGPGTPDWVPLFDISPYMATAVVVCEDGNFWVHGGFNQKSIRDSIRDDLRAGKFVRGGSTVSMQLAKNLYLAREKTLSRKLQEAILTLLLEQSLTKEQILELYFNVIEFAPGLYGIGPAAEHYFKTTPRDLSLAQSFYLVSIFPNPKIHHFAADGALSPGWTDYLHHLMEIAHKLHKLDDRELAQGLAESLRFGQPSAGATGAEGEAQGAAPPDVLELAPHDPEVEEGP
jgi:hypothetical protein